MSARGYVSILFYLASAVQAAAQGFAGLGTEVDGYPLPDPTTEFSYPADHGPHPEFRIEWWYLTANLRGSDGEAYGIQWTLFRNAIRPGGAPNDQVWMGHAAISSPDGHFHAERFARGGIGQADVTASPFEAHIDEWSLKGPSLADVSLTAQGSDWAYDLAFTAEGPFVPQGINGYSVKSDTGQASHYYSQPFYTVDGTLTLPDGEISVSGSGWLDREWSSQPLAGNQSGWDWFSLHLEDGAKMMGFQLRDADGAPYTTGTWITADGLPSPLTPEEISMTAKREASVAGRSIPVTWQIEVPSRGVDVTIDAIYDQSWMPTSVSYWEGPVSVTGSHRGRGYLEMTGYE